MSKSIRDRIARLDFSSVPNTTDIHAAIKHYTRTDDHFFTAMRKLTGNEVQMYNYVPYSGALPLKCHRNAPDYAKIIGGKTVNGWRCFLTTTQQGGDLPLMWHHGVVTLQQHMLVESNEGILYDTTPDTHKFTVPFGFFWRDDTLLTDQSLFKGKRYSFSRQKFVHAWGSNIMYHPLNCKYFDNLELSYQQLNVAKSWFGNFVSRDTQFVLKTH